MGLKTFLTCSDGSKIDNPLFLKQSLCNLKRASKQHSKKHPHSANRERARKHLVRQYEKVSNRRRDWFWKLAHQLTDEFDVLCFETLNLKGMQRLCGATPVIFNHLGNAHQERGRKISDLALGEFLQILEWVAVKKGKQVVFIDQWYPSTKTCSNCGNILERLDLSVREWRCPSCNSINGRDENAAKNICAVGASTVRLGDVRQGSPEDCCLTLESPVIHPGEYVNHGSSSPVVVEVVSTNWQDDYAKKLEDYEDLGILEYWIVDYRGLGGRRYIGSPKQPTLSIYTLVSQEYQLQQFRGDEPIVSRTFREFNVSAAQLLSVPSV